MAVSGLQSCDPSFPETAGTNTDVLLEWLVPEGERGGDKSQNVLTLVVSTFLFNINFIMCNFTESFQNLRHSWKDYVAIMHITIKEIKEDFYFQITCIFVFMDRPLGFFVFEKWETLMFRCKFLLEK